MVKLLSGVEILEMFERNENAPIDKVLSTYSLAMRFFAVPYSKLRYPSSDREIYSWIISTLRLECDQEYYFLCDALWLRIRIVDLQLAVKSMWQQSLLLINTGFDCVMEAGCDSRDEDHYLIDIWNCKE